MKKIIFILFLFISSFAYCQVNFCTSKVIHAPIKLIGYSGPAITYSSLDITPTAGPGIWLINCANIHIVKCKIHSNHNQIGIILDGCKNIKIDTITFEDLAQGDWVINTNSVGSIHVNNNQYHNISDPNILVTGRGHAHQWSHSNAPDMQFIGNKIQNDVSNLGIGDMISSYKSGGTIISPELIENNWGINGGTGLGTTQQSAFCVIGDNGGNYTIVSGNIAVNPGFAGITCGSGVGQTITGNIVYSASFSYSSAGITSANFTPSTGISSSIISDNRINWYAGRPTINAYRDTVFKPLYNTRPTGWSTNIIDRTLNASILPSNIIQQCSNLTFNPIPNKVYGVADFSPGATSTLPITYISSNTSVETIVAGLIHIIGVGTSTITATDGIDTLHQNSTITKAQLNIIADNKSKAYLAPLPTLSVTINEFKYSDTQSIFLTPLTITTTATQFSFPGLYKIIPSGATAANYNITFYNGWMIVGANVGFTINIGIPVIKKD